MLEAIYDLSRRESSEMQMYASAVASLLGIKDVLEFKPFCENLLIKTQVKINNIRVIKHPKHPNELELTCSVDHATAFLSSSQVLLHISEQYTKWIMFLFLALVKGAQINIEPRLLERQMKAHRIHLVLRIGSHS